MLARGCVIASIWLASFVVPARTEGMGAGGASRSRPPCDALPTQDRLSDFTEHGDIKLSSGRIARLAGIRRPEDSDLRAAATAWLASHAGSPVEVSAFASQPDRWGRVPAAVAVLTEAGAIDLGRSLVAAGLALVDAGGDDRLCQTGLLAAEERARELDLGLWRSERYKPVLAADLDRLQALRGEFAVVEGRVRSVGERRQRTYLNFGSDWKSDLTITIPKRTWQSMRDRGFSPDSLRGRRVGARGIVEDWQGRPGHHRDGWRDA